VAYTFSSIEQEVLIRMENRVEDTSRADIWLRDSLLEMTSDPKLRDEFDELEVIGPTFNLTGGAQGVSVQEYPFSSLLSPGVYNTSTLSLLIWTDPPQNTNRWSVAATNYQDADQITPFPGLPVKWYRYGDSIGFVPTPDLNYQVQARIYKQHPINDANLPATVVLIADDWREVLILAAVIRGYIELGEFEKAAKLKILLYGDPDKPDEPGLMYKRKKRRDKEMWRRQQALSPRVRRYSKSY
jgi:hypothetical protein